MARIYYDQCEVKINNTGVLAVSANLNSDITMGPVYTLGKRKPFRKQITTGPSSSTFQISYLINQVMIQHLTLSKRLRILFLLQRIIME